MNRRSFFGALAGSALVTTAIGATAVPDTARFSHVSYGQRPYGSIGPYVEWRDRVWWIGDRAELRWACIDTKRWATKNNPDYDWAAVDPGLRSISPADDVLWLHTFDGKWAQLTIDQITIGEQHFIGTMTIRVVAHD